MYTKEKDHLIWTNEVDYDDWKDDLEEYYPDEEGYDDDYRMDAMYEINNDYLDDEKANLNKELGVNLVMIGYLSLWSGNRTGWKHIKGTNLNDIFQGTCGDYITWYVNEEGDICCDDCHHDGTNCYVYRAIKNDITDWEFDELMAEGKKIDDLTEKLGHYVKEIYGW